MSESESMKLSAFILVIAGTIGLLLNEFITDLGRSVTITFAGLNILGLVVLAFTTRTVRK